MTRLKDIYSPQFLEEFALQVATLQDDFDCNSFSRDILSDDWESLSVRQRMKKIAFVLNTYLSGEYPEKLRIILALHQDNQGFNFLFLPDFVSLHGLNESDFYLSLDYLKQLTAFSSSEFPIRDFISFNQDATLSFLITCSQDENEHIRRLASEGTRPRLPWGYQLPNFREDPTLALPILENLKNDPSLYVRKSVANHLNDVSKDYPDFVVSLCKEWAGETNETDWIIKRACRSLLKQAYPPALALFGYDKPGTSFELVQATLTVSKSSIKIGQTNEFSYLIQTSNRGEIRIRLEYGVNYIKANGQASLKKFHLFDGFMTKQTLTGNKKISFKQLSTRTHYTGEHQIILFCNGQPIAETHFLLV